MNKRRRAYKRYDWRNHCMQLMSDQLKEFAVKANSCAIEIAILYGKDAIGWKSEELVLQAGLWRIVVSVAVPYRIGCDDVADEEDEMETWHSLKGDIKASKGTFDKIYEDDEL